jgi:hypothetical protein
MARFMRVINLPMRQLLRLPFQTPLSRRLMLLSFTGRRTGRQYRQPVSYVPDGDTLLTLTSFVPFVGKDRQIDHDQLRAAVGYGFSIVRWHLGAAPAGGS